MNIIKKTLIWFGIILFLEILFILVISKDMSGQLCVNIGLSSLIFSIFLTVLTSLGNRKINTITTGGVLLILGILYATQAVFYKIFKVYFSLYNLTLQDQLSTFWKETITFLIRYFYCILLFMIPFIIFLMIHKKINLSHNNWQKEVALVIILIGSISIRNVLIDFNKEKNYSTYDIYHNVNNISMSIKKIGVLNTYLLEIKRIGIGFTPETITPVILEEKQRTEKTYDENKMNLVFSDINQESIQQINQYIEKEESTLKNDYTGMFEGYNIVYITAESFSEIGIREDVTPTLYKLTHSGFIFHNFYTPNNLSTIGGEFQSLTGLYPDYSILRRWRDGTNYFPFGLGTMFQKYGYHTYAYHDNQYNFQDRNQYLTSQGFTNYLACGNGLEERMNCNHWPQSDVEMIQVTTPDYIGKEEPFLAYYMTVSGHFAYTFNGNYIASKNRDLVEEMEGGEPSKAYVATQIELDRALELLIKTLEEKKQLDHTVIVLMADHYPYELDTNSINQLSSYERNDMEINHNALILWNSKLETKEIDKPCMSVDVLPTIYNLFGMEYDSRLFSGKDILSNSFGIAVLSDRSWVTEKGIYNASTKEFQKTGEEVEEDYIEKVNQLVNNRLNISRLILENDYYRTLFS